jgi:hypothetical protein
MPSSHPSPSSLIAGFNISGTIRAVIAGVFLMVIGSIIAGVPNPLDRYGCSSSRRSSPSRPRADQHDVPDHGAHHRSLLPRAVFGVLNTVRTSSGAVYPQQGFAMDAGYRGGRSVHHAVHAFVPAPEKHRVQAIAFDLGFRRLSVVSLGAATMLFRRTL